MLLRYLELHGEETGQQNLMIQRLSNITNTLLSISKPHRSALVRGNNRRIVSLKKDIKSSPYMCSHGGVNHLGQKQSLILPKREKSFIMHM